MQQHFCAQFRKKTSMMLRVRLKYIGRAELGFGENKFYQ
jgi:hypothetical protein